MRESGYEREAMRRSGYERERAAMRERLCGERLREGAAMRNGYEREGPRRSPITKRVMQKKKHGTLKKLSMREPHQRGARL